MRPPPEKRSPGAALVAGLVCGGLWTLFVSTILAVARPEMTTVPLTLGVWTVTGLGVAAFFRRPGTPRQIWGRVALTAGLHALALPVAAAIAFGATGIWPPPETADQPHPEDVQVGRYPGDRAPRGRRVRRRSPPRLDRRSSAEGSCPRDPDPTRRWAPPPLGPSGAPEHRPPNPVPVPDGSADWSMPPCP